MALPEHPHGTWEPRPAARWEDAFLSGNGRHGALAFGDPNDNRLIVTHHTLVRPDDVPEPRPPALASRLALLQDQLLAGDTEAGERFTDGRPLRWVPAFHPAFQLRFQRDGEGRDAEETHPYRLDREGRDADEGLPYRRSVDFATGVVEARCGTWRSRAFVSRADDVVVQYVTGPRLDGVVSLDHRLTGVPDGLRADHRAAPTRHGARLTLHCRYPDSPLSYTGVTLAVVSGGQATTDAQGLRVAGAEGLLLLTRVRRHPGELDLPGEEDRLAELLCLPEELDVPGAPEPERDQEPYPVLAAAAYASLLTRHETLHRTAYERVTFDLGQGPEALATTPQLQAHTLDAPTTAPVHTLPGSELVAKHPESNALLERLFAAGRYHLLSSSGILPPRLTGLWTGEWDTAWSGAFTTDANLNLQVSSAVACDLPEVIEAHTALIRGQLADWRDNAREVFGAGGIVAPAHTDGESGHTYHFQRAYPLHLWTAGADWLLTSAVEQAEATGVRPTWLIDTLRELALFYEDFLARTGPDGRLVIVPSYSPENRPANASWVTLNATMDIAAARHALRTAAAFHPGPDGARWTALAERLPDFRVNAAGALAEWAWPGLDDNYGHRHLSHLYPVWPHHDITPYDTPELARAARRALELRGAENDSAHGHLHHALIAARLRDTDRVTEALRQVLTGDYFHASLMSAHYPGRDVYNADAAHTLPALVTESLIQSTPHRLVLLPAPPPTWRRGQLRGVRTRFGAAVDLSWGDGSCTAVLRPIRDADVELIAPGGDRRQLRLRADEDRELSLSTR